MSRAEDRQRRVAQLRRDGESLRCIGEALGVSRTQVMRDVRAIEARTGEPLTDYVRGADDKFYMPKTTVQDYEVEPGYDDPGEVEEALSSVGHLTNALSALQQAGDALRAEGERDAEIPELLAEIRAQAARLLAANKALPKVKSTQEPE